MTDLLSRRTLLSATAAALTLEGIHSSRSRADEKKPQIKVGQIGVSHAHATKLEVYRNSPDYEVVGIVEPNKELRERASEQPAFHGLPFLAEEQLLNTQGLSAVLVETHVRDLLSTAERCIKAGKHVHLDKPAGQSLPQYRQLLAAAEQKKLLVQMGYMYRYSPAVIILRQFLKEGWLGDVFEVHTVMSKVVGDAERKKLAEFSGGIMFELGCHVIDLVIGVLGRPDRVHSYPRHSGSQNDGLADNVLAVLEYPKATATVKSSAEEVDGGSRRHFVVCGTAGTFHIQPLDSPAIRLTLDRDRAQRGSPLVGRGSPDPALTDYKRGTREIALPKFPRYVADAADMARIIRGEKESDFSYAHDLIVQHTVLAAGGMPA